MRSELLHCLGPFCVRTGSGFMMTRWSGHNMGKLILAIWRETLFHGMHRGECMLVLMHAI